MLLVRHSRLRHVDQGIVCLLQFFRQNRVCSLESCLLCSLLLPPPHLLMSISEVRLEVHSNFDHVMALIPLLAILRQYSRLINDGVHPCHYLPVINCPPASKTNYWTSNALSTRPSKRALASHDSLSHALFSEIINGLIGH